VARFRLLKSHALTTPRGIAQFDPGYEFDSSEFVDFRCTALMEALDPAAEQMLKDECDRLRTFSTTTEYGEIPGVGPIQRLPA
jgi:hypothetical protein